MECESHKPGFNKNELFLALSLQPYVQDAFIRISALLTIQIHIRIIDTRKQGHSRGETKIARNAGAAKCPAAPV